MPLRTRFCIFTFAFYQVESSHGRSFMAGRGANAFTPLPVIRAIPLGVSCSTTPGLRTPRVMRCVACLCLFSTLAHRLIDLKESHSALDTRVVAFLWVYGCIPCGSRKISLFHLFEYVSAEGPYQLITQINYTRQSSPDKGSWSLKSNREIVLFNLCRMQRQI